ncbi:MAG: DUF1905 domain-containing protein [Methylophilaceae bacterium]
MIDLSFTFTAECWLWQGKAAWHFITLPQEKSEEIKFFSKHYHEKKRGWDMVQVEVAIGNTRWQTSIFPYNKASAYILPIKASVRKKEKINTGDRVQVKLKVNL